jgi:dTDP-4-amino-4,6-dideoxygalactose transaminase
VAHAVAVSNATAGLHIACLALGVGPGSLVWTSPNSFLARPTARSTAAQVDFVDIDPVDAQHVGRRAQPTSSSAPRATVSCPQW